jgi:hypothetical protein
MNKKMKSLALAGLLLVSPSLFAGSADNTRGYVPSIVAAAAVAVAAHYGYRYWTTPDTSMPTLDELQVTTLIPVEKPTDSTVLVYTIDEADSLMKNKKFDLLVDVNGKFYRAQNGIPSDIKNFDQVSIYSGGLYNNGRTHASSALKMIRLNGMHGACITFNYAPDYSRTRFNFGQEQDIACLDLVYKNLLEKNPDARVVLRGACKGGVTTLHFLAQKAAHGEDVSNVKAAVIESSPLSAERALSHYPLSHGLVRFTFPNYNPNNKTILDATVMPNVPLFIGRIPGDTIANHDDIGKTVRHVQHVGNKNNAWLFTARESIKHGLICKLKDYQLALNAFYKQCGLAYNLPVDDEQRAIDLLKEAKESAERV